MTVKGDGLHSFEAAVEQSETKTIIDGMKSYWNGEESLWVLNGQSATWKKKYKTTVTKQEKAIFVEDDKSTVLTGDDFLAIYPANQADDATWTGTKSDPLKKCWLEIDQTAVSGSYDTDNHIAIAYAASGKKVFNFMNVVSLVKFTIKSTNVYEVCFYAKNSEYIAGNFEINYNDGNPSVNKTGDSRSSHVKVKPNTGNLVQNSTYYMSVLPTEFSKGFALEMIAYGAKGTLSCSDKYSLRRNQILDLGDVTWTPDSDANFYFELDTDNLKQWFSPAYLYVWTDSPKNEPLGAWPGKKMTKNGNTYNVTIPKEYIGKKLNFIVSNGSDWKTGNKVMNTVWAEQTYKGNANLGLN